MGLFYKVMISEIKAAFVTSGSDKLEEFLKEKEESFKEEYKIGDTLFYLNIMELLEEMEVESEYFSQKFKESNEGFRN